MFKTGDFIHYVNPTEENKPRLIAEYESIPDHEKRQVEGMDDKDHHIRSILYKKS